MGNVAKEERMLEGKKSDDIASFSSGMILPMGCILLAFGIMSSGGLFFPFALRVSAFLLFTSACLWDLKGLFYSSFVSFFTLLSVCPSVFVNFPSLVFFLLMINTCIIVAILKRMWKASQKSKERELLILKSWESHYHVFRMEFLEKLEEVRKAQESLFFMEEQIFRLEKERMEGFLEEDELQKSLIEQLTASQEQCELLQKEIGLLEEVLLAALKEEAPTAIISKPSRKKKGNLREEAVQGSLF
jgi:hypothetical protein